MARINLSGMGVALITPFKEDESIDFDALSRLIEYLIQNGTDYLVVLGTTAETPTLTETEKEEIKNFVVERAKGRIPLVLGLGGNNTRGIVEHLKHDDSVYEFSARKFQFRHHVCHGARCEYTESYR